MRKYVLVALFVAASPIVVVAQGEPVDRFDIAAGGRWLTAVPLGTSTGTLTTPDGGSVTLFSTETRLGPTSAVEGRFGVRLSRHLFAEGAASFGFSRLTAAITDDAEGAADVEVSEAIRHLVLSGGLVAEISAWRMGARAVPFVTGGAGYLRQLHEGRPIVEEGRLFYAGAGLNVLLSTGTGWTGRGTAVGLRFDTRFDTWTGGISLDDQADRGVSTGIQLFFRF